MTPTDTDKLQIPVYGSDRLSSSSEMWPSLADSISSSDEELLSSLEGSLSANCEKRVPLFTTEFVPFGFPLISEYKKIYISSSLGEQSKPLSPILQLITLSTVVPLLQTFFLSLLVPIWGIFGLTARRSPLCGGHTKSNGDHLFTSKGAVHKLCYAILAPTPTPTFYGFGQIIYLID